MIILEKKLPHPFFSENRFNVDRNGKLDKLTTHGGCPVLKGTKWITNKWTRHCSQMFRYPCTLNFDAKTWFLPRNNDVCKMGEIPCQ